MNVMVLTVRFTHKDAIVNVVPVDQLPTYGFTADLITETPPPCIVNSHQHLYLLSNDCELASFVQSKVYETECALDDLAEQSCGYHGVADQQTQLGNELDTWIMLTKVFNGITNTNAPYSVAQVKQALTDNPQLEYIVVDDAGVVVTASINQSAKSMVKFLKSFW